MPITSQGLLAECQRLESLLQDIKQRAVVPQPDVLTECEHELADIVSSLENLRRTFAGEADAAGVLHENAIVRQTLRRIQQNARDLSAGFLHGANYCAGLLQIRLGTGYSDQGLPVLVPSQSRNSFEG
jgi:hypothetical protein